LIIISGDIPDSLNLGISPAAREYQNTFLTVTTRELVTDERISEILE
jgi:hypothetical protein